MSNYRILQGKVFLAERDSSGNPLAFRYPGDAPQFDVNVKVEVLEHKESTSGQRQTDARVIIGKDCDITVQFDEITADNLALALYGSKVSVGGSTASAEALPTVAVGDFAKLANTGLTNVVITDSTGSPKTLTLDTNYRLNAVHGSIEILDITTGGPFTQPFKAAYTYAARTDIALFKSLPTEKFLRVEGLDAGNAGSYALIEIYRAAFDPPDTVNLIGTKFMSLVLKGKAMADDKRLPTATLGQFGKYVSL